MSSTVKPGVYEGITDAPCNEFDVILGSGCNEDKIESFEETSDPPCGESADVELDSGCSEDSTDTLLASSTPISEKVSFQDTETTTSKTYSPEEITNPPCNESVNGNEDVGYSEDKTESTFSTSSPVTEKDVSSEDYKFGTTTSKTYSFEEITNAPCDETVNDSKDAGCSEDVTEPTVSTVSSITDNDVVFEDYKLETTTSKTYSFEEITNAPCDETVNDSKDANCSEDITEFTVSTVGPITTTSKTDSLEEIPNAPCDETEIGSKDADCSADITESTVSTVSPIPDEDVSSKDYNFETTTSKTYSLGEITNAPCDETVNDSQDAGCSEDITESTVSTLRPVSDEDVSFKDNNPETTTSKTYSLEEITNAPCDETVNDSQDAGCSEDITESTVSTLRPVADEDVSSEDYKFGTTTSKTYSFEEITNAPCDKTEIDSKDVGCSADITESTFSTVSPITEEDVSSEDYKLETATSKTDSLEEISNAPCDDTEIDSKDADCGEDTTESTVSIVSPITEEDVFSEDYKFENTTSKTDSLEEIPNAPCDETEIDSKDADCSEDTTESTVSTVSPIAEEDVSSEDYKLETATSKSDSLEEIANAPCDETEIGSKDADCSEDITEYTVSTLRPVAGEDVFFEDNNPETTTSQTNLIEEITNAPCNESLDVTVGAGCNEDVTDSAITTFNPASDEDNETTTSNSNLVEDLTHAPCDEDDDSSLNTNCDEDVTAVSSIETSTPGYRNEDISETIVVEDVTFRATSKSESASLEEITHAPCDETTNGNLDTDCIEDLTESAVSTDNAETTTSNPVSHNSFCEEDEIPILRTTTTTTSTPKTVLDKVRDALTMW